MILVTGGTGLLAQHLLLHLIEPECREVKKIRRLEIQKNIEKQSRF
jgi:nucleoside-diphosphate-sugar epimerase